MLRSNSSVGGKLLLIFITFLLTIALIVGAVFIVYKKVQVKSIANILGADSLISESYDGTIEDFVKLLSDTLSDGSVALDDLTAISPFVGDAVNGVLDDLKQHKVCTVVCRQPARVQEFVVRRLARTATVWLGYGAYTGRELSVVMTVLTRSEALKLEKYLRGIDPDAFVTYVNTSQITGHGFRWV